MSITISSLMDRMAELSRDRKNVIDIKVNWQQSFFMNSIIEHHILSSMVTKGITEILSYGSYSTRQSKSKKYSKVCTNHAYEGQEINLPLYPLYVIGEQMKEIEQEILTPDIYKIGIIFSFDRVNSEWVGCAYLIKV